MKIDEATEPSQNHHRNVGSVQQHAILNDENEEAIIEVIIHLKERLWQQLEGSRA